MGQIIMDILVELYEDQTGEKYEYRQIEPKDEPEDKTA